MVSFAKWLRATNRKNRGTITKGIDFNLIAFAPYEKNTIDSFPWRRIKENIEKFLDKLDYNIL